MAVNGTEKIIDDPVMVDGKFVRNVGATPEASLYTYVYLKDGDKDTLKRAILALKIGCQMGSIVGALHLATFGRSMKFPSRYDPFVKIAFSVATGAAGMFMHASTVAISSQLQGNRDLVRNWVLAGGVSGLFVSRAVTWTPRRAQALMLLPLGLAVTSGLIKVGVVFDKPLRRMPVTNYGVQACNRSPGPRYYDTINPYIKQEEHYLEKFL